MIIDRDEIKNAVVAGNLAYWKASEEQRFAYNKWRDTGFEGTCPHVMTEDVVEYITRAVVRAFGL